jgi:hypothetical protein
MASAIFARTGATFSYVATERLRIRFGTWLATTTPSQDTRHGWVRRALDGGPAPPDADILVVLRRLDDPRRGDLLGRCRWHGTGWDIVTARPSGRP